ncbi:unnamed protein product [Chrysodeixis includens]|uniref:Uncharacterized protein n=1 Tax=Chrysodeixis includens TaxID=689277 RepID=A0A9N8KWX1_CHRIL|nr:unnamed protein product [Chrysodeixis includens]
MAVGAQAITILRASAPPAPAPPAPAPRVRRSTPIMRVLVLNHIAVHIQNLRPSDSDIECLLLAWLDLHRNVSDEAIAVRAMHHGRGRDAKTLRLNHSEANDKPVITAIKTPPIARQRGRGGREGMQKVAPIHSPRTRCTQLI